MIDAIIASANITIEIEGNSGIDELSDISKVSNFETVFCELFPVLYENVTFAFVVPGMLAIYELAWLGPDIIAFSPGLRFSLNIAKQPIA